ncbi:hypothetical protein CBS147311_7518 [Penicillium roqueforti]|nr:hypothetical protein CBS147311_7518 [Penicillium roqueforti]
MASQPGLTNMEATMGSRKPTSTRPKLDETLPTSHSPQRTDSPSTRLEGTKVSPVKLLTTSRAGMPFHKTAPTLQYTNRRRDAASDSSSDSGHFFKTITTHSTIPSELYSRDLDHSYCVDLDDFSVPLDARVLSAPSFRQLQAALSQHDSIIGGFSQALLIQLFIIGLSYDNGAFVSRPSPRTQGMSVAKEPNWWLSPADVFDGLGGGAGFPTLALEVGVSESYSQLCKDAQWWYSNFTTTRKPTW